MKRGGLLARLVDFRQPNSVAGRLRQKRWDVFRSLTDSLERPLKILDVGGFQDVWERIGFVDRPDIRITMLNIVKVPNRHWNIECVEGDACSMPQFHDGEFDVVYSNSVIEHVGGDKEIQSMANEIRRVGQRYYVQTPNRYFPVEPHFVFPMFQFMPVSLRVTFVQHFPLGWFEKIPDRKSAEELVRSINLLSKRQVRSLFPDAVTVDERFFVMSKSIQAVKFNT
jgi:ubiquinone/menaquinone biosynthesis C-methylase UbiE